MSDDEEDDASLSRSEAARWRRQQRMQADSAGIAVPHPVKRPTRKRVEEPAVKPGPDPKGSPYLKKVTRPIKPSPEGEQIVREIVDEHIASLPADPAAVEAQVAKKSHVATGRPRGGAGRPRGGAGRITPVEGVLVSQLVRDFGFDRRRIEEWHRLEIIVPSIDAGWGSGSRRIFSREDCYDLQMLHDLHALGVRAARELEVTLLTYRAQAERPPIMWITPEGATFGFEPPDARSTICVDLMAIRRDVDRMFTKLDQPKEST